METKRKVDAIRTLEEAFPYIPEKEQGYILGYAEAVKNFTKQEDHDEEKETA